MTKEYNVLINDLKLQFSKAEEVTALIENLRLTANTAILKDLNNKQMIHVYDSQTDEQVGEVWVEE